MKSYTFHNNLILRTPLKPFKGSFSKEDIRLLAQQPQIQEALFLASPVLHTQTKKWLQGKLSVDKEDKLVESLYKYLVRTHTRCTPFGLLAGITVGEWSNKTNIVLNSQNVHRNTRLDMNYLCSLAQHLEKEKTIRIHLKYFPNSSIHIKATSLHYIEYFYKKSSRQHRVNSVDYDGYLQVVLEKAKTGCCIAELSQSLIQFDSEIELQEAEAYINLVINAQILVSELEPAITGKGLIIQIIRVLERIVQQDKSVFNLLDRLCSINDQLQIIDKNVFSNLGRRITEGSEVVNNLAA